MNLELEQQRVLVVGAAGTIGKAVTQAFLQEGCSVVLLDKDPLEIGDFPHAPERLHAIQGDVRQAEDMSQAVAYAKHHLGGLDHAIYTVGAGSG
ncbi:MAG: SDR family NAD(P)-dependent oxidoreductase, partial [Limisphaerales bacterium]